MHWTFLAIIILAIIIFVPVRYKGITNEAIDVLAQDK
jgi:hypothetical protein